MTTWTDHPFSQRSGPDCPYDSQEPRADEEQPREYVTEIPPRPSMTDARRSTRQRSPSRSPGHDRVGLPAGALDGSPAADRAESGVWGGLDLSAADRAAGKAVAS